MHYYLYIMVFSLSLFSGVLHSADALQACNLFCNTYTSENEQQIAEFFLSHGLPSKTWKFLAKQYQSDEATRTFLRKHYWLNDAVLFHQDLHARYVGLLHFDLDVDTLLQSMPENSFPAHILLDIVLHDIDYLEILEKKLHSWYGIVKCQNHAWWVSLIHVRNAIYNSVLYQQEQAMQKSAIKSFVRNCKNIVTAPFKTLRYIVRHVC